MLSPPRTQTRTRDGARVVTAFALALLAHGAMVALIVFTSLFRLDMPDRPKRVINNSKAVTLRGVTTEQWMKNRGQSPKVNDERKVIARNREEKKEAKKKEEIPKGQIVDVAPGNNQVDPNAKFVAETSNTTARESRAKEQTAFYRNAMPQRTATQKLEGNGSDTVAKAQTSGNQGVGDDDRPLKTASPRAAMELPDVHKRQEISIREKDGPGVAIANRAETQELKGNSKRLNLQPGSTDQGDEASAGRAGVAGTLNLVPSAAVIDKITGAAANDHLQDVAEGEGTFLNTREWKYASFFNRVKQSVGQHWSPGNELRARDPSGSIYGGKDRYTVLAVTLDETGRLKDAYVEKSSGVDFLDVEAVKAFERAQPFPNPPPGLLATDQTVKFQFGFFLELTGRPGMRLFRSAD